MTESTRLSKIMSQRGIASRRQAEKWINKGWVRVSGETANDLGKKYPSDVEITLEKSAKEEQKHYVTLIFNKPPGVVSSQPEKGYEPAIKWLRSKNKDSRDMSTLKDPFKIQNLVALGRLDINSSGLLLFSNDPTLAKAIIGDQSTVDKEYLVILKKPLLTGQFTNLKSMNTLEGRPLKSFMVENVSPTKLLFTLCEGKKRQIRRMCAEHDIIIDRLRRTRVGPVKLGSLKSGFWKTLPQTTVDQLKLYKFNFRG